MDTKLLWLVTIFAVSSISYTITRAGVFEPIREWAKGKNKKLGDLFECPYCMAHWVTFFFAGLIGKPFAGAFIPGMIITIFAVPCFASLLHMVMLVSYKPIMEEGMRLHQVKMQCARIARRAGNEDIADLIMGIDVKVH